MGFLVLFRKRNFEVEAVREPGRAGKERGKGISGPREQGASGFEESKKERSG